MVNFGLNSASILGIFLAVAGASLYFMRSFRPELSRDQDIFFAAVGLLCGFILLFQGWRLDPILQFGQFLLTTVAVAFGVETLRLRSATAEQAKRGAPTVDSDRDRRSNRVYKAEIDDMEPSFEQEPETPNRRRLRGSMEERSPRRERYEQQPTRSSRSRSSRTKARSRSRPTVRERGYEYDEPDEQFENPEFDEEAPEEQAYIPPRRPRSRRSDNYPPTRSRRAKTGSERASRPRPSVERPPSRRRPTPPEEDYVDYKPLDSNNDEDELDDRNEFDY